MAQIDTLKYYKDLKAGGVSDEQAEAEIRALQSALDGIATKEDLKNELNNLEVKINSKIDAVEADLNTKTDSLENRLNAKIDSVEARLNAKIDSVATGLNTKIDSIKTIGWAIFAAWLAVVMPVFKLAFFS